MTRRSRRAFVASLVAAIGLSGGAVATTAQVATAPPADVRASELISALDSVVEAHVRSPLVAGASVAVVHRGETLLQRGYGYVDLEWDVETPADAAVSYEIGSVTKQFTAAAIMLLVEDGALDLDADLTDYVEFDTQGHAVPVRRLLDHTSGIKGYTEMPIFGELSVRDLPRDTLLRLVEAEPFEFEPGTAQIYNNSAYFILGLIIEEVSGRTYDEFVAERLFRPAGMNDSYYCSESRVTQRRAHGYDAAGEAQLDRAAYLDHQWPFAAGSLCSSVGDLARWNAALHGGEILSAESYAAMTTPQPLLDGMPIRYAMGLGIDTPGGRRVIAHGGGINGFLSQLAWYPDEDLTVVVLQNTAGPRGPGALASELAARVLGPTADPEPMTFEGDFGPLTGTYRGPARGRTMELSVLVEDGALAIRSGEEDGDPTRPDYRGGLRWDTGNTRFLFVEEGGPATELHVDGGGGHYVLRRTGG